MTKLATIAFLSLASANIVVDLFGHIPTQPHQYLVEQR